MKYKKIPNTDLEISVISLGTWVFGGDSWNGAKDEESIQAVYCAIDSGINLIDTAPIYGNGKSEEIVGKAIKNKRAKVILATKCGLISKDKKIYFNLSAESIKKEIEDSLKRLQVDYIDLYQCHRPDPNTPIEETMTALKQLQAQGKIRYIGVSNYELGQLKEAMEFAKIVSTQNHYSILERTFENDLLDFCGKNKVGILTYGALGGGILSGKYTEAKNFKGSDARNFFYKYYNKDSFSKIQTLLNIFKEINKPFNQTAINWLRQKDAVTTVLAGCRNAKQVLENVKAVEWDLTQEEIDKISTFQL